MIGRSLKMLPIVSEGKVVGIVTSRASYASLAQAKSQHLKLGTIT
ncbi:MAG: hypothetical protein QXZ47_00600 [Candidatus Bathyarchaeia archaeon]